MHKDICPNCSEELYIFEVQAIEQTMSDEFMEKVVEQRRMLQKRLTK